MIRDKKNVMVFAGSSNEELALKIAEKLGVGLGDSKVVRFADGEVYVRINQTVRGADVFVVQSTSEPVNENLMELLVFIDALKRASARSINVVIPYYGYARQDRKASPREPITAKLTANLLTTAGANRVITMDLHANQIQGFFDIPVDHLEGLPILAKHLISMGIHGDNVVVVSPDIGGVKRARKLSLWLDCKIAIIDKRRPKHNMSEVMNLIGDVEGKVAIMIDDMIDTGGTITAGADALKNLGATAVYACCTHGVFSGPAIERINDSVFEKIYITDTIRQPLEKQSEKIEALSVDLLFAETIKRIVKNEAISPLFDKTKNKLHLFSNKEEELDKSMLDSID